MESFFGNVVYAYTREQAIKDGVLIDVTSTAKEAGFRVPVAVTATVWNGYIVPQKSDAENWGQSTKGRLWDLLHVLHQYALRNKQSGILNFIVYFKHKGRNKPVELKSIIGPGDRGEPVITVMFPNED